MAASGTQPTLFRLLDKGGPHKHMIGWCAKALATNKVIRFPRLFPTLACSRSPPRRCCPRSCFDRHTDTCMLSTTLTDEAYTYYYYYCVCTKYLLYGSMTDCITIITIITIIIIIIIIIIINAPTSSILLTAMSA
ncbi:predicted protein [Plenodomus lingam JN3]|uniref:Predicted protein n=1 Tax=Leptosphaeria maculans (strain JN3 / isolate v23.1.3 / race Av1-4-5-6-7-8) TaxID=985895 RepID=E5AF10_LEPMJ|nr:predicted protein [Plenodomus lingam JN3]CBY01799.1 predicted protein [Plenodomus lingam JN3]